MVKYIVSLSVGGVAREKVPAAKDFLMAAANARGRMELYTWDEIVERAGTEGWHLWMVHDPEDLDSAVGAALTQLYRKGLTIVLLGGQEKELWFDPLIEVMETTCLQQGIDYIDCTARKGFLPDAKRLGFNNPLSYYIKPIEVVH